MWLERGLSELGKLGHLELGELGLGGVCSICEHREEVYSAIWLRLGRLEVVKRLGSRRVRVRRVVVVVGVVVSGKTGSAALCSRSRRR